MHAKRMLVMLARHTIAKKSLKTLTDTQKLLPVNTIASWNFLPQAPMVLELLRSTTAPVSALLGMTASGSGAKGVVVA